MQENFELRIREIAKLKKGWHFGSGDVFHTDHIEIAVHFAKKYSKLYNYSVSGMPNVNGDIDLTFSHSDYFLDVRLRPSLKYANITFYKGLKNDKIEENWGEIPLNQLDDIMSEFSKILARTP